MSERKSPRASTGSAFSLAALPGAVFGGHLGFLLLFLNPEVPFGVRRLLAVTIAGALACGLFTGAFGLLFRRRRWRRLLPWGLTIALALAAVLYSSHASHYAFYLPPRINDQLLRTAAWLTLATLICFYTALLHSLGRRPYGWRSRAAFWLLTAGSFFAAYDRRNSFVPLAVEAMPVPIDRIASRPNLVVVGIDTLSLDAVLPLAEEGGLSFLSTALETGAYGPLRSLRPSRHRASWTTVATGQFPFRHGILGAPSHWSPWFGPASELRLLPAGLAFQRWGLIGARTEPESPARHLKGLPLPELLARLGVPTGSVGWPASSPRDAPLLWQVSDRFFGTTDAPEHVMGEVAPRDLAARARLFEVAPGELETRWTASAGPVPSEPLLEALAIDQWRVGLTAALRREAPPRALFLHLPGLERLSRAFFADYAVGRLESPPGARAETAARELGAHHRYLAAVLEELWLATPPPRLFVVVSASGPEVPGSIEQLWRWAFGGPPLGGAVGSTPDGAVFLLGDAIRPGTLLTGARTVDVVPTLLYGLGLPVARDLDGRVWTEAFRPEFLADHPLAFVPTYRGLDPRSAP
jgi:hypothetical protein